MILAENFWQTHEGTVQSNVIYVCIATIIITAIICYTIWRIITDRSDKE